MYGQKWRVFMPKMGSALPRHGMLNLTRNSLNAATLIPQIIAYESAILGDKEQVFFWLHKAYSEKSGALEVIKIVKPLQPFRSDPRYIDLLKRMGLPGDGGFAFGYTPFA